MTFATDVALEMRFARTIKAVLGMMFFEKREFNDLHEATDFAIFTADPVRCAVRLRRYDYYERYPDDVTIRWWRPSNTPTEIDKIRSGLVNHMFYGFVSKDEAKIIAYSIVQIPNPFDLEPLMIKLNNPPDSKLAIYRRDDFPIIKKWERQCPNPTSNSP